jgi:ATP-dependent helicase/nuclease subunit A
MKNSSSASPATLNLPVIQYKQHRASDPTSSGWVSASAGTGKTKVLVDRLLRILLSDSTPETIVCLTFTNAAASEMKERLLRTLKQWAIADSHTLTKWLSDLGHEATEATVSKARGLFMAVLDNPLPIYMGTIHGFCQKLLYQFPLEANISPHFTLMDQEQSTDLLNEVQNNVLRQKMPEIETQISALSTLFSFDQFNLFLKNALQNSQDFLTLHQAYPNLDTYKTFLKNLLQVNESPFDISVLKEPAQALLNSTEAMDQKMGISILNAKNVNTMFPVFLTKEGKPRKRLCSQKFCRTEPNQAQFIIDTAEALETKQISLYNKQMIDCTCAFLHLFSVIHQAYAQKKVQLCALDFNDIIVHAKTLLNSTDQGWVFHKLDAKIHHLLVDEAQDTSPLQWHLITLLVDNMLTHTPEKKSFFVVGDQKQSIYSFQGARPDLFESLHEKFRHKFQTFGLPWFDLNLDVSFRSTEAVLKGVDETFKMHPNGVYTHTAESHIPFRQNESGLIQLLPLVAKPEQEDPPAATTPWPIPTTYKQPTTPADQLANQVACHIHSLLESGIVLPATGSPIKPADIMVLVRKRGPLVNQLIQALKHKNVPVAGLDRLSLKNHLAVQDLLAFGQFLCLPNDDYSLACVLKSPLVQNGWGFSEEQLFDLCHGRSHSLWRSLWDRKDENSPYSEIFSFLNTFLSKVDYESPYVLYAKLLHKTKPFFVARFGEECLDVLEEFQNTLLNFSKNHTPTLQGFLNFMQQQDHVVKRDPSAKNTVRILTIHGSKGLQAPVVILPDSTDKPSLRYEYFLWFTHNQSPVFLLKPKMLFETPQTRNLKENVLGDLHKEHQRLFYVALTRAQDQLYLGGFENTHEESWYEKLYTSLGPHWVPLPHGGYMYNPIGFKIDCRVEKMATSFEEAPSWLNTSLLQKEKPVTENLKDSPSVRRGILIHKLLESLSSVPNERRTEFAKKWSIQHGLDQTVIHGVLSILENPLYGHLFGKNSLAEVSLVHQGQLKRIDRLVFLDDAIYFVDFKTHKKIPYCIEDVPQGILDQMYSYGQALQHIYKKECIRAFLLWTEGPILMEISIEGQ